MASSSSSSTTGGVPPGFRFHPTDDELLLYYLKKKISLEKFDLEVIREVDLNKIEPWDLQDRCRIGATPQNEWYFFSHKDRKYPTGSRTNRATSAGFWKATGRDKCIRNTYKKIGMRKTLVFYRGRAPHGQKTDWIMHEYRLEDSDDDQAGGGSEDGWVVCRVFKKKCFFKIGGGEGSSSQGAETGYMTSASMIQDQSRSLGAHYSIHHQPGLSPYHHHHPSAGLALHYPPMPANPYSQVQVQDLLTNHQRSSGAYDFPVMPGEHSGGIVKPYEEAAGIDVDACEQIQHVGGHGQGSEPGPNDWSMLDGIEGRFGSGGGGGGGGGGAAHQMSQISGQQRGGGEMDLWAYGK